MNRFAYVLSNPMSLIDPNGLFTCPVCGDNSGGGEPSSPPDDPGSPVNPGSGGGGAVANPGAPFVFKVNATTTSVPNLELQVAVLESIPFDDQQKNYQYAPFNPPSSPQNRNLQNRNPGPETKRAIPREDPGAEPYYPRDNEPPPYLIPEGSGTRSCSY